MAAFLVGAAAAVGLIIGLDYGWGFIRERRPDFVRTTISRDHMRLPHPTVGYVLKPDYQARHQTVTREGVVYDVTYSTDNLGRRVTVNPHETAKTHFLAFWGCSLTFGTGVREEETMPSCVAALVPDAAVYNYGVEGYGTANVLAAISTRDLGAEIPYSEGIGIYTFVRHHPWRNIGSMRCTGIWGADFPAYSIRDGELVYLGPFRAEFPWRTRLYYRLARSALLAKSEIPPVLRSKHFELTVRLVQEARAQFTAQFPKAEFAVLIYPYRREEPQLEPLVPLLRKAGIRVFDYSLLPLDVPEGPFFPEGHPRPKTDSLVAAQLVADLYDEAGNRKPEIFQEKAHEPTPAPELRQPSQP